MRFVQQRIVRRLASAALQGPYSLRRAARILISLAGKTTFADIGINFLADIRVSETLAWIFGGSCAAYGWHQRALRKKTVERLQQRVVKFESEKDSGRTSSQLTTRGSTNPEDKQ